MPNHNLIALSISHFLRYKLFFLLFLENLGTCVAFSLRAELLLNGFSDDLANYMRKSREHEERERERHTVQCVRESERLRIDKKPNTNRSSTERQREREREREAAEGERRRGDTAKSAKV